MLRVIGRVTQEPDPALVAVALLVCFVATITSLRLARRAVGHQDERGVVWISAAALVFSCGVWTTHVLSMSAFTTGLPIGTDLTFGTSSLLMIAIPAQIAFGVLARRQAFPDGASARGVSRRRHALAANSRAHALCPEVGRRLARCWRFALTRRGPHPGTEAIHGSRAGADACRGCGPLGRHGCHDDGASRRNPVVSLAVSKWALPFAAGGGCMLILALPLLLILRRDRLDPGELAAEATPLPRPG